MAPTVDDQAPRRAIGKGQGSLRSTLDPELASIVRPSLWTTGVSALRIAMVAYGDIRHDSRVQREANTLADAGHDVTLFCLAGSREQLPLLGPRVAVEVQAAAAGAVVPGTPSPFHHPAQASLARKLLRKATWLAGYIRQLRAWGRAITADASRFDVWHAHDFAGLVAVGGYVGSDVALVYDVHDLFTESGTARLLPGPVRRAILRYERHLVRRVDFAVTVNEALADVIEVRCRPRSMIVVHNCPPRWTPPQPRPDLIREVAGIPPHAPVVLYHGLLSANRGIERLLEAILHPDLGAAHLALMGFGPLQASLSEAAAEARFEGRVHVLDPVPPGELLPWVASADVGAMAMPPASRNLYLSTPNKLFECLAAGTPVVVSDFPAIRAIVDGDPLGPLGAICDPSDAGDVARALAGILALDRGAWSDLSQRCNGAAHERWNWESEARKLIDAYDTLARSRDLHPDPDSASHPGQ
jgi:glycosyltransferase involved in cell wall biosynthesis